MTETQPLAPELAAASWFNTTAPLTLEKMRGRNVVQRAIQKL